MTFTALCLGVAGKYLGTRGQKGGIDKLFGGLCANADKVNKYAHLPTRGGTHLAAQRLSLATRAVAPLHRAGGRIA